MFDMVNTLDLTSGMFVQRGGTSGLLKVTDVREPSHPAMPGLVVAGHYWRSDEYRWNDRETLINVTDVARREWHVWTPDMLPPLPDERYDVGSADGDPADVIAWRIGAVVTVRQFSPWLSGQWPYRKREITEIARRIDSTARKVSDSITGGPGREIHEQCYVISPNVTIMDPDDPADTMPMFDGPADTMAERLAPGRYTDDRGRMWTVTAR